MKTKKLVPSAWCLVLSVALCAVGLSAFAEKPEISAVSAEGFLDLTVGDRIAKDVETIVVDPAWDETDPTLAKVQIDGEDEPRTYTCASNDLWQTASLEPGRYEAELMTACSSCLAGFWKIGADWVVFDSSNITADVTFEAGKTYLMLGTNTVDATLTVTDGAKFEYAEGAGFKGGTVTMSKRYGKEIVEDGLYQIAEKIKGCADNPWNIGEGVTAYTNGTELVIGGEGTVADLSEISDEVKGEVESLTIATNGVTGVASEAFEGLGENGPVALTLPDGWDGELPDDDGNWYGARNVSLTAMPLTVKNVTFAQRYPWNGKVDIGFDVTGPEGETNVIVTVCTNGAEIASFTTSLTIPEGGVLTTNLVWDAAAGLAAEFKADDVTVEVKVEETAITEWSDAGWLDLTVGDRVAKDVETLVVDPAWGEAASATVDFTFGGSTVETRTYNCASNDTWQTARFTPGRYTLALEAGTNEESAAFWKIDGTWEVLDLPKYNEGILFPSGMTFLLLGVSEVPDDKPLTVEDGAKFEYAEGAGFKGGKLEMPKRYRKETVDGDVYRIVEAVKGSEDNPWMVGEGVEAYTNGTKLVIVGEGTITDLSGIPVGIRDGLGAITIAEATVTGALAGAFDGSVGIALTLPDGWQGELPKNGAWYGALAVELTGWPMAVKNVKPQQRYPWNGLVDVNFDLTGEGFVSVALSVTVDGKKLANPTVTGETTFDLGDGCELKGCRITWDAKADFGDEELHEKIKVKLSVSPVEAD